MPRTSLLMALGVLTLASAGTDALGDTDIAVPNSSFATGGQSLTAYGYYNGVYAGGNNPYYANQNPNSNPYPNAELYAGWVSTAANYQSYQVSTTGTTGLASGITTAADVNYSFGTSTISLNPVVSSIDSNAIYTLTLSLAPGASGNANSVTLLLVSTTSAADPVDYNTAPYGYYTSSLTSSGTPTGFNPTPLITPTTTLASTTISAATLDAQGANAFGDYTLSFGTHSGDPDAAYVGQNLSIEVFVNGGVDNSNLLISNVRLSEDVPEPGTWAMMLLGAVSLLLVARRRLA